MWIRTQDRNTLIDCKMIEVEKNTVYTNGEITQRLGIYPTEARALEVLDEIQKAVLGNIIMPLNNYVAYQSVPVHISMIYEMPKE